MLKKNLKKYIVFQIWGNNPLFLIGMIENIKLATIIYPSWKVRIYYSDIPDHFLIRLKKCNIELISEKINDKIKYQIWRILPLFDKRVDIFICRDADSRLNYREKAAVDDWLESEKPLHIMRDHPIGHKTLILAGMCGFNNIIIKKTIKIKDSSLIHQLRLNDVDSDQEFLRKIIFPFFSSNHLAHDKYSHFEYGCERDFPPIDPSKRIISNFVGEVHDFYNNPINWNVKKKLKNLNLDNVKCCEIYGFKIPTQLECIKLEKNTENDHDYFQNYHPKLSDKKIHKNVVQIQQTLENCKKKDNKNLERINGLDINIKKCMSHLANIENLNKKSEKNKNEIKALNSNIDRRFSEKFEKITNIEKILGENKNLIESIKLEFKEKINTINTSCLNIGNNMKTSQLKIDEHTVLYQQIETYKNDIQSLQKTIKHLKNNQFYIKGFIFSVSTIFLSSVGIYYKEYLNHYL